MTPTTKGLAMGYDPVTGLYDGKWLPDPLEYPEQEQPSSRPTASGCPPQRDGRGSKSKPKGPARRRAIGERFAMINAFVDGAMAGLSRAELAVWLTLWRDTRNGFARTGRADLARRCGVDRRTVTRAIARLTELGLIRRVRRGSQGAGIAVYAVVGKPDNAGQTNGDK
jgi:DNA-binding transcriptional ArsR family regulator